MAKRKASSPIELLNGDDGDKHGSPSAPSRRKSNNNNNNEDDDLPATTPKRSLTSGIGSGGGVTTILPPFSFGLPFGTPTQQSPLSSTITTPKSPSGTKSLMSTTPTSSSTTTSQFVKLDPQVSDKMSKVNEAFLTSLAVTLSEQPDALLLPTVESYVRHVHAILTPHLPNGIIPGLFSKSPLTTTTSTAIDIMSAVNSNTADATGDDDDDDSPTGTSTTFTEDNALYDVRCKVFRKVDGAFKEKGIGQLFVKKLETGKHQVVVRADNNLGTILLNVLLQKDLPLSAKGKDVMTCYPAAEDDGKPTMIIIRVKDETVATELLTKLQEYKNTNNIIPGLFSKSPAKVTTAPTKTDINDTTMADKSNTAAAAENEDDDDEDDNSTTNVSPTKFTEDNALYEVRCKVFRKVDGAFIEKGIGQLFVKKLETGKHQVVIRAENNLGTILLNVLLQKDLPLSSKGKDVLTCYPAAEDDGKPMMFIIRVKNENVATELLTKLQEFKNNNNNNNNINDSSS